MRQGLKKILKPLVQRCWYGRELYHPRQEDRPYLLRLDITNRCNFRCPGCFYPAYLKNAPPPKTFMPLEDYQVLAARLFPYAYSLQMGCNFEMMLHPQALEILRETDRYAIPMVSMVTNGSLLNEERIAGILALKHLKAISISIDGYSPEVFAKMRGRDQGERVKGAIARLCAEKNGQEWPNIVLNIRILRSNLDDLPRLLEWALETGVDYAQFFHVAPQKPENGESVLHEPQRFNAIRSQLDTIRGEAKNILLPPALPEEGNPFALSLQELVPENLISPSEGLHLNDTMAAHPYPENLDCICPWMVMGINSRGDLTPCVHRFDYFFGNILCQERDEAHNSIRILKLRKALRKKGLREACPQCQPGIHQSDPLRKRV